MVRLLALAALLLPALGHAGDIPLSRDPQKYLVLGLTHLNVSSLAIEAPGCNLGVDCAPSVPGSRGGCGFFHSSNGKVPEPGQVAANQVCGTKSFFQVFSNLPTCTDPACAAIQHHGSKADCTDSFAAPIIGDVDRDGRPSCDDDCVVDPDDVAAICGVTLPLPACDPSKPVTVDRDSDCSTGDVIPGNGRCDLAAGAYGDVFVAQGARIDFAGGTTVVCSLNTRTAVRVRSNGPAMILVPGSGNVRFNNSADVGSECGILRVVSEKGLIKLGRYGDYNVDACTIGGKLRLGHGNNLRGHFVGNEVNSDISNNGRCCGPTAATTSTTTTTTTTTLHATTMASTTTTTSHGSTTTIPSTTSSTLASTTTMTGPSSSTTTTTAFGTTTTTGSTTTTGHRNTTTTATSPGTTTTSFTTTTTLPQLFTRTPGFYQTHPDITQQILMNAGGLMVCGHLITNVQVRDPQSAIEGLCVKVRGNQRLQLLRQLLCAGLNMAAGGANYPGFAGCDASCQDPSASTNDLANCIDQTDAYNQSGDAITSPFDPPGPANPSACQSAFESSCTLLTPMTCDG